MVDTIVAANRVKYHKCEQSCPFLQEPLVTHFGFHGEGPQISQFNACDYIPPKQVDEYNTAFIECCQGTTTQSSTNMTRTPEEF